MIFCGICRKFDKFHGKQQNAMANLETGCCSKFHSFYFDMKTQLLSEEKKCFDLLTPSWGWGCVCVCKDRIVLKWCSLFHTLWYATWLLSVKKCFDLLTRGGHVWKDRICACMVLYAPFQLIWYVTWLLSEEKIDLTFDPTQGSRLCVRTQYVLAWYSMLHSL